MSVLELLDERIQYARERQIFWKDSPQIKQVWIGIEQELKGIRKEVMAKPTQTLNTPFNITNPER